MTRVFGLPASFTDAFLAKIGVCLPDTWDPVIPVSSHLAARVLSWATSTRKRRLGVLPLLIAAGLTGVGVVFPAEAQAAVGWRQPILFAFGMTDSYGIDPASYAFTTSYGSVFDGGSKLIMGTLLEVEGSLFVLIGASAIWMLKYALSFGFLPDLIRPIAVTIQDMARQIVPAVASLAAVVAAFVIAINVKRNPSRAVSQLTAGFVVAALAAAVLSTPITWAISDHGPLVTGRDLAVAAAENSTASNTATDSALNTLQGDLLTHYVRRPLQAWNFGAIADDTPGCAAAWSKGVDSRDPDNIKDGIADCGAPNSAAMKNTADNPSAGQVVTGFGFLLGICVLFVYAITTTFLVLMEFMKVIGAGVKTLWGTAVGLIPGGPQRSLFAAIVSLLYSGIVLFGFVTVTVVTGRIVTNVFREQPNVILAMIECLFLNAAAVVTIIAFSRRREKNTAAITDGFAEALGDPAPRNSATTITKQRAGAFLPAAATVALTAGVGVGASMAGEALAQRYPRVGEALKRTTGLHNNTMLTAMSRGAYRAQDKNTETQLHAAAVNAAASNHKIDTLVGAHTSAPPPPTPSASSPPAASPTAGPATPPSSTRPAGTTTAVMPSTENPPTGSDPTPITETASQPGPETPAARTSPTRPQATPLPPQPHTPAPPEPDTGTDHTGGQNRTHPPKPAPASPFSDTTEDDPAPPAPPRLHNSQPPPTDHHNPAPPQPSQDDTGV